MKTRDKGFHPSPFATIIHGETSIGILIINIRTLLWWWPDWLDLKSFKKGALTTCPIDFLLVCMDSVEEKKIKKSPHWTKTKRRRNENISPSKSYHLAHARFLSRKLSRMCYNCMWSIELHKKNSFILKDKNRQI